MTSSLPRCRPREHRASPMRSSRTVRFIQTHVARSLIGSGRKVTPDTPFLLGSISKSFTAMAVMQLVEAGKVDLDTGISHYLDVFAGRPVRRDHHPATAQPHQRVFHPAGQRHAHRPDPGQGRAFAPGRADCAMDSRLRTRRPMGVFQRQLPGSRRPDRGGERSGICETTSRQRSSSRSAWSTASSPTDKAMTTMARGHRPWFGTKRPMKESRTERVIGSGRRRHCQRQRRGQISGDHDEWRGRHHQRQEQSRHAAPGQRRRHRSTASAGSSMPTREPCSTPAPAPESKRSRPWFRQSRKAWSSSSMRAAGSALAKRLSSATASPPEPSAWITPAKEAAGNKRHCSSHLPCCRLLFLLSMIWAWLHRDALRAKSGAVRLVQPVVSPRSRRS